MIRDRIRLALVVAAGLSVVAVTFATDRIFDARYSRWLPVIGCLVAMAITILNPIHRTIVRTAAQAAGAILLTAIAVWTRDGDLPGDVVSSFIRGLARIVAVRWPAPAEPIAVGGIVLVCYVATAIATELAWSRRFAAVLLLPPLGLVILVALLSPKAGPVPLGIVVFVTTASAVVLRLAFIARTQQRHEDVPSTERGANALVASVLGLVAVLPVAVGAPFGDSDRFDVRELHDEIHQIDEEISPLSRLDEWRSLNPAQTFFSVSPAAPNTTRWRIVALTRYDGRAWMPSDDFRPIGEKLGTSRRGTTLERYTVTVDRLKEAWAPFTGDPVESDLSARVDSSLSGIRLADRFTQGDEYDLTVAEQPTLDEEQMANATADSRMQLPEDSTDVVSSEQEIRGVATEMTRGATSDYEKALFIATALSTNYSLNRDAPAGHSLPQLRLFLTSTKTGRDEQFVAAYALLARSIGLPVRISVGVDLENDGGDASVARSDKVVAWPEVAFSGKGWVTFDPVPEREADVPAEVPTAGNNGATGQVAPPPPTTVATPDVSTKPDDTVTDDDTEGSLSVAARFAIVAVLLVLAVLAYIATVLTMKRNRRLRRALAERTDARITGAFMTSVDLAVDLGASSAASLTNRELVRASAPVIGGATESFDELAALATRAIYAGESPGDDVAEQAWAQADEVNERTAKSAGRLRWMRAKVSLRSLRQDGLDGTGPTRSGRRRRSMS